MIFQYIIDCRRPKNHPFRSNFGETHTHSMGQITQLPPPIWVPFHFGFWEIVQAHGTGCKYAL